MLAADANNTVYALARDLADAPELVELAAKAPHKNVHTGKLDLLDVQSIKVRKTCSVLLPRLPIIISRSCRILTTFLQQAAETIGNATGVTIDVLIHNGAIMMHPLGRFTLESLSVIFGDYRPNTDHIFIQH